MFRITEILWRRRSTTSDGSALRLSTSQWRKYVADSPHLAHRTTMPAPHESRTLVATWFATEVDAAREIS